MSDFDEPTRAVFESGRRGLRNTSVRRANERAVLTVVGFNSGASNAEISRLSGLAPQTVSAILADLERDGLIGRGPVLRGRRGQPATPILLNENGGLAIGVEIGWRQSHIALLNMHAKVLAHAHFDHDYPDARSIFDTIGAVVDQFRQHLTPDQQRRLLDLGLSMPGGLADKLHLLGAPQAQTELWKGLDPAELLADKTGLTITVLNDGNAGCWAELIALEPPRPANVIYLLVSHFLAAGVVGDGALWEGVTGHAADLGAILVSRDGHPPEMAHSIASIWALRSRLGADRDGMALALDDLAASANAPQRESWISSAAAALAQVIYNATTIIEQPVVVVDTVLSGETSTALVGAVGRELALLPSRNMRMPRLVAGKLGRMGPVMGAAELTLFRRYFQGMAGAV